jgi:hypothetical protein
MSDVIKKKQRRKKMMNVIILLLNRSRLLLSYNFYRKKIKRNIKLMINIKRYTIRFHSDKHLYIYVSKTSLFDEEDLSIKYMKKSFLIIEKLSSI